MMIGGGGELCKRADHGIGITEANDASFVENRDNNQTEYDFGYDAVKCRSIPVIFIKPVDLLTKIFRNIQCRFFRK